MHLDPDSDYRALMQMVTVLLPGKIVATKERRCTDKALVTF